MLRLICGETGTGKSTLLRERMKAAVNSGKKAVLFVPDQFSFEAEKLIYKEVPHKLGSECRVAMFSREAQRILRLNGETKLYADDIAKRAVIKLTLEECCANGELTYYRGQAKCRTFPSFALRMISDIRNAGLSPSALRGRLAEDNGFDDRLTDKMNDIAVIYSAYDRILTQNFSDRLDDVRRAAEIIRETDIFDGYEIFFDEFDSFSGTQQDFIRALLGKADNVTLAMTCLYPDNRDRRFNEAFRTISHIAGDEKPDVTLLDKRYRKPSELVVTEARDKWQECDWICSEIRALTDSGARYRDIAVLSPDIDSVRILDSTMKRYGITAFTDIPEPLISKWFVRFPIYTLLALSFETDDLLRYVKSGFVRNAVGNVINAVNSSNSDADKLERFCRTYDLRRRDWLKPFPTEADTSGELEELRKCVIDPLAELSDEMGLKKSDDKADGGKITECLCDFICNKMRITDTIYSKCITGTGRGGKKKYDGKLLDSLCEIWDDTVTVFESAHKALSGHLLTLAEYTDILTDIFTSTTIAKPPQTLDAVIVGDTERSRFTDIKYVFICGFNRGSMPPAANASEIFTPSETEKLSLAGIPVAKDTTSRSSQGLFTVYRCVNIPSQRLYLTYPAENILGDRLEPSDHLGAIEKEYGVQTRRADDYDAAFYCRTERSAERYLAGIFRDKAKRAEKNALCQKISYNVRKMLEYSSGLTGSQDRHSVTQNQASALITMQTWSPSAIEQMNNCKFAFFCKYGLDLRNDSSKKIDNLLVGKVIHYCLEQLLSDHLGQKSSLIAMTDDDIAAHVAASINKFEQINYYGGFGGTKRFSYLLSRLSRYAVLAAIKTRNELSLSAFEPAALEQDLSFMFADITISGTCDRLDTASVNGKTYLRTIDYKRSDHAFKLSDIYSGNNIQPLLYLLGACNSRPGSEPSSASYLQVGKIEYLNPEKDSGSGLQKYMRDHKPSGFMVSGAPDADENAALNSALNAMYHSAKSSYIPLTEIGTDIYSAVKNYCEDYLRTNIREVTSGMAGAIPSPNARCESCSYSLFCGKTTKE